MKKRLLLMTLAVFGTLLGLSQSRVQVIHNCADPAASSVDIYANGLPFLPGLNFREATEFIDAPSGIPLTLDIVPAGGMLSESVATFSGIVLDAGQTYVVVANGIVSGSGFNPSPAFNLDIYADAREEALDPNGVDVLAVHGSTDAGIVDVVETLLVNGTLIDDFSYSDFGGYFELGAEDYRLAVTTSDESITYAEYDVPLASLGLQGSALTLVASGFLSPMDNSNGPSFGLWVADADGGPMVELPLSNPAPLFARLQVIHNSPDAPAVDIFANGGLFLGDLAFREASAFVDVPAGVALDLAIAPEGLGIGSAVATFEDVMFDANETYIVVANGIVSASGYNPSPAFTLDVFAGAREMAGSMDNTDVLVIHGSTDAPTVDVLEVLQLNVTAINDFGYSEFAGYLELPTLDYRFAVATEDQSAIVATYDAPLETLGLNGAAVTVVASGFLDPSQNSDGPAFGLWVALADGGALIPLPLYEEPVPTARVQIIHNSADAAASPVDIFADGELVAENVSFRQATAFMDAPAGVPMTVSIAPAGQGVENAVAEFPGVMFMDGETYVVVANGIVSGSGYNPSPSFNLDVFAGAREEASQAGNTDVLAIHGSTDAPTVDVVEVLQVNATVIDDFDYTEFAGYLELPTADYRLAVTTADQSLTVATYDAPLAALELEGVALTVVASGFLNPSQNSDGPAFGLWVALPTGGDLIPLPLYIPPAPSARVQVIHNSADLAAGSVDVFANGEPLLTDFAFRTASGFVDVPAGVEIDLAVAPAGAGVENAVATVNDVVLTDGETYVIVANGIVSGTGYTPSPSFSLDVFAGAREEASQTGNVDVLVLHGSTDAPVVDVVEDNLGVTLADDLAYQDFAGYLELGLANYVLNITSEDGATPYFSYSAPLAALGLEGQAITVVASGFLDPSSNSNGADFGLWVALADGGELIPLPTATARLQIIHNSADPAAAVVDVYAAGLFTDLISVDNLGFRQATSFVDVPANVAVTVEVAGPDSNGPGEAIVTETFTLEDGETYIVTASGNVGTGFTPEVPFSFEVFAGAREAATNSANVDVLVLHGATDAPSVDVNEVLSESALVEDLAYAEYAGYLSLPEADYVVGIAPTGDADIALFQAPLATLNLAGAALTVVASGYLNPAANNDGEFFGLWVATATGGDLIPLPAYLVETEARVQVIHNAADAAAEEVDVYITSGFSAPIVLDNFAFRTASPFVDVISETEVTVAVAPADSEGPQDAIATFDLTLDAGETYVVVANGIVSGSGYNPAPAFGLDIYAGAREEATASTNTDVLVYHGATDAPTVDVVETGVGAGTVVDNIAYSEFEGYLELATNDYELSITTADGATTVAAYEAPLSALNLDGAALTVLASGFLNPANNSNGPGFGLWVALPAGGDLIPLPLVISVEETELASGLMIYPNPANQFLSIRGNINQSGTFWVSVVDASGREIMTESLNTGTGMMVKNLDVSQLASGMYTLQLFNGQQREAVRFTIEK
jgi:hypothetical protein